MSNDPRADLIYGILAMDSYNRGYGSGIKDLGEIGSIGNWAISANSSVLRDVNDDRLDISAGFYVIAYRNAATDEVVISYRGTNSIPAMPVLSPSRRCRAEGAKI